MKRFCMLSFFAAALAWGGCSKDEEAAVNTAHLIGTWELTKDYDGEEGYWDTEWGETSGYYFRLEFHTDGKVIEQEKAPNDKNWITSERTYELRGKVLAIYEPSHPEEADIARIVKLTARELVLAYDYTAESGKKVTDKEVFKRID